MLNVLRRSARVTRLARLLCADLINHARAPEFFQVLAVPDTIDGRFDLVALHTWLVLERLQSDPVLAQALVDEIFANFDDALRYLGTGDVGMNRRLKTMASAFYGRLHAYRAAPSLDELGKAIHRNLYRGVGDRCRQAEMVATYAWAARSTLARTEPLAGKLEFPPLPNM
ncbi:MAG TPA: ubiquinol-cytochrome C chaperone family protein [Rhizomicrobium sp.]|jgi:cytochrome b pre-mRNA-processing protein 3|nr:ubiquinol-cytochrome C chaperone family protein [Rhizomicrobium sp.]